MRALRLADDALSQSRHADAVLVYRGVRPRPSVRATLPSTGPTLPLTQTLTYPHTFRGRHSVGGKLPTLNVMVMY